MLKKTLEILKKIYIIDILKGLRIAYIFYNLVKRTGISALSAFLLFCLTELSTEIVDTLKLSFSISS